MRVFCQLAIAHCMPGRREDSPGRTRSCWVRQREATHGVRRNSVGVGRINAIFGSFPASCLIHSVKRWVRIVEDLCLLPSWPKRRVLGLAPVS